MRRTFTVEIEAQDGVTATSIMRTLRSTLTGIERYGAIKGFSVSMPKRTDQFNILEFNSNNQAEDEEIIF